MSKALVIYLMCGPETPALAEAAVEGGADLVLVCLSGRGDKDLSEALAALGRSRSG